MSMTDPVADLLTRIRNANENGSKTVTVPFSGLKKDILRVLKEQGYILDYVPEMQGERGVLRVELKYGPDGEKVIRSLRRVSSPGRRFHRPAAKLTQVLDGLGMAVISTSRGVMSDTEARKLGVGGEILCEVW